MQTGQTVGWVEGGPHLAKDVVDVRHPQQHAGPLVVLLQNLHQPRVVEGAVVLQKHLRATQAAREEQQPQPCPQLSWEEKRGEGRAG
jgi:hypothetical protein